MRGAGRLFSNPDVERHHERWLVLRNALQQHPGTIVFLRLWYTADIALAFIGQTMPRLMEDVLDLLEDHGIIWDGELGDSKRIPTTAVKSRHHVSYDSKDRDKTSSHRRGKPLHRKPAEHLQHVEDSVKATFRTALTTTAITIETISPLTQPPPAKRARGDDSLSHKKAPSSGDCEHKTGKNGRIDWSASNDFIIPPKFT